MIKSIKAYMQSMMKHTGTPEEIACGAAIGLFVGLVVPPGIQMIVAFLIAAAMNCNRVLAVGATWITNPVSIPIIYSIHLTVGSLITGIPIHDFIPVGREDFWELILSPHYPRKVFYHLVIGAIFNGTVVSVIAYYFFRWTVIRARRKERAREFAFAWFHSHDDHGKSFDSRIHPQRLIKQLGEEAIHFSPKTNGKNIVGPIQCDETE